MEPHGVDALSITMGPETDGGLVAARRFSVYAVSKAGLEAHWGDGVASNVPPAPAAAYEEYVIGDPTRPGYDPEAVRRCTAQQADLVAGLISRSGKKAIVGPAVAGLRSAYQTAAG